MSPSEQVLPVSRSSSSTIWFDCYLSKTAVNEYSPNLIVFISLSDNWDCSDNTYQTN